jgi:hypothetical protein
MAVGEKLFEEKGKVTMSFVKEVSAEGIEMILSFSSAVKGFGTFPNGTNIGSGTVWLRPDGMAHGTMRGILMTDDHEMWWSGTGMATAGGGGAAPRTSW